MNEYNNLENYRFDTHQLLNNCFCNVKEIIFKLITNTEGVNTESYNKSLNQCYEELNEILNFLNRSSCEKELQSNMTYLVEFIRQFIYHLTYDDEIKFLPVIAFFKQASDEEIMKYQKLALVARPYCKSWNYGNLENAEDIKRFFLHLVGVTSLYDFSYSKNDDVALDINLEYCSEFDETVLNYNSGTGSLKQPFNDFSREAFREGALAWVPATCSEMVQNYLGEEAVLTKEILDELFSIIDSFKNTFTNNTRIFKKIFNSTSIDFIMNANSKKSSAYWKKDKFETLIKSLSQYVMVDKEGNLLTKKIEVNDTGSVTVENLENYDNITDEWLEKLDVNQKQKIVQEIENYLNTSYQTLFPMLTGNNVKTYCPDSLSSINNDSRCTEFDIKWTTNFEKINDILDKLLKSVQLLKLANQLKSFSDKFDFEGKVNPIVTATYNKLMSGLYQNMEQFDMNTIDDAISNLLNKYGVPVTDIENCINANNDTQKRLKI